MREAGDIGDNRRPADTAFLDDKAGHLLPHLGQA